MELKKEKGPLLAALSSFSGVKLTVHNKQNKAVRSQSYSLTTDSFHHFLFSYCVKGINLIAFCLIVIYNTIINCFRHDRLPVV